MSAKSQAGRRRDPGAVGKIKTVCRIMANGGMSCVRVLASK